MNDEKTSKEIIKEYSIKKDEEFFLCPHCFRLFYDKELFLCHMRSNHFFPSTTKQEFDNIIIHRMGWASI